MPLDRTIIRDFEQAREFSEQNHHSDVEWIRSRDILVESFDDFFQEYVYVIIASGFRAIHAARLTPKLVACRGSVPVMLKLFKNRQKVEAISKVWNLRKQWKSLRESFTDVDALTRLPRIGPIVKYHLARNIGLQSVGKPDLHLVRYAAAHGWKDSQAMVQAIADEFHLSPGTSDFMSAVLPGMAEKVQNTRFLPACGFGSPTTKARNGRAATVDSHCGESIFLLLFH